jgi:hypothetical protein
MTMHTYQGGCHCGAVRFEIRLDRPIDTLIDCNCSLCTRKGILHHAAEDEQLTLLQGESDLALYQFGSGVAKHWFCRRCGIHVFGRPRNNPDRYTINARCLDDFHAIRPTVTIQPFDGVNHPKDRPA